MNSTAHQGYVGLMFVLEEARSGLRFETLGPVYSAIGQGEAFSYFDEIRKIISLASIDLLFVDPYLDADFVDRYLPHVQSGVSVRLLASKRLPTLIPAVKLFTQQYIMRIELRSDSGFYDRCILVDGKACPAPRSRMAGELPPRPSHRSWTPFPPSVKRTKNSGSAENGKSEP